MSFLIILNFILQSWIALDRITNMHIQGVQKSFPVRKSLELWFHYYRTLNLYVAKLSETDIFDIVKLLQGWKIYRISLHSIKGSQMSQLSICSPHSCVNAWKVAERTITWPLINRRGTFKWRSRSIDLTLCAYGFRSYLRPEVFAHDEYINWEVLRTRIVQENWWIF